MNKLTQTIRFRQSLVLYALKHGVTKAAIRYRTNRQYVYRRLSRYGGTPQSLTDKSRRPHGHANRRTAEELKLISDMHERNKNSVECVQTDNGFEFTNSSRRLKELCAFSRRRWPRQA